MIIQWGGSYKVNDSKCMRLKVEMKKTHLEMKFPFSEIMMRQKLAKQMVQLWISYMLCFSWEKENLQEDEEVQFEVWRCYGATCEDVMQVLQEGERHSKD